MSDNLKEKAGRAVSWAAFGTGGRLTLQFVYSIVMARLLTPDDFGVMAVMMVINGIVVSLIDGGFSQAIIQKEHVTNGEITAVFYLGFLIAFLMMGVLVLLAPAIANFFNMPILRYVAVVLSLDFILRSFSIVQTAILMKELKFKALAKVGLTASILASLIAVALAWLDWGVWSLVVYTLSFSLFTAIGLWRQSSWRPQGLPDFSKLQHLFRFGIYILLTTLIRTIFERINTILIGKFYSAKEMGFYSRAESTQALPSNFFLGVVSQVTFPLFSSVSSDPKKVQAGFKKASGIAYYLYFPAMIGIFASAESLVGTLYGSQWAESVPMIKLYVLGALFWFPGVMNVDYLKAIGRSREYMFLEMFQKTLGVIVAFSTVKFGIMAMLVGFMIVNFLAYFVIARVAGRAIGFGGWQQLKYSAKIIFASTLMGLLIWGCSKVLALDNLLMLLTQVAVGGGIYLIICYLLKVEEQSEILHYGIKMLRKKAA